METQGRSYKNHFGCAEMPERQTGCRQTRTNAAGYKEARKKNAWTDNKEIKENRQARGEKKDEKGGKTPKDMWKDRQAEADRHTHDDIHKGLVRRLESAGGLCCIH